MAINLENLIAPKEDRGEFYELYNHNGDLLDTVPTHPLTENEREMFDDTVSERLEQFSSARTAAKMVYGYIMFLRANPDDDWATFQRVIDTNINLVYDGYYLAYLMCDRSSATLKKKQPTEAVVVSEPGGNTGQPRRIPRLVS